MNNSEWVDIKILADALGFKTETLRRGCASEKYVCRFKKSGKYKNYEIAISSLPSAYLKKYNNFINKQNNCLQLNSEVYDNAQEWQRKQADKYLQLFTLTEGMSYNKTVKFLKDWNVAHPDQKVCYTSLYYAKQKYKESGVSGLLSQKGQGNKKQSIIPYDYYEYYKSLYLREGAPSAFFCWQATLGYAKDKDNVDILKFPSYKTFERLLKSRVPEQAIYMARFGNASWNKKYASYIPRDYSNLRAGSCWVSDHAQIDVAVSFNGSVCPICGTNIIVPKCALVLFLSFVSYIVFTFLSMFNDKLNTIAVVSLIVAVISVPFAIKEAIKRKNEIKEGFRAPDYPSEIIDGDPRIPDFKSYDYVYGIENDDGVKKILLEPYKDGLNLYYNKLGETQKIDYSNIVGLELHEENELKMSTTKSLV